MMIIETFVIRINASKSNQSNPHLIFPVLKISYGFLQNVVNIFGESFYYFDFCDSSLIFCRWITANFQCRKSDWYSGVASVHRKTSLLSSSVDRDVQVSLSVPLTFSLYLLRFGSYWRICLHENRAEVVLAARWLRGHRRSIESHGYSDSVPFTFSPHILPFGGNWRFRVFGNGPAVICPLGGVW
jgi:hypothetical protein